MTTTAEVDLEDLVGALQFVVGGDRPPRFLAGEPSQTLLRALEQEGLLSHLAAAVDAPDLDAPDLYATGRGTIDPRWPPILADAARRTAYHNLRGLATLTTAHRALKQAGIDHLALKGPASNHSLYGPRARRVYGDLDIAVRPTDRDRAVAALAPHFRSTARPGALARFGRLLHFHTLLVAPPSSALLPLELHWSLLDRFNLLRPDFEAAFGSASRLATAGLEIPVLDPATQLVYLCCHLSKHAVLLPWNLAGDRPLAWVSRAERGFPLSWLVDLHQAVLVAAAQLDAQPDKPGGAAAVIRIVSAWNATEEVDNTLALLDRLTPAPARTSALATLGLATHDLSGRGSGSPGLGSGMARALASERGQGWVNAAHKLAPTGFFRPIRLLGLPRVLLPSPARLRAYHRSRAPLVVLYPRHLRVLLRRLLDL